jgi:hypothetical protein
MVHRGTASRGPLNQYYGFAALRARRPIIIKHEQVVGLFQHAASLPSFADASPCGLLALSVVREKINRSSNSGGLKDRGLTL